MTPSPDFSNILIGYSVALAVCIGPILAVAGVVALVEYTEWGAKLVARFFNDDGWEDRYDEMKRRDRS